MDFLTEHWLSVGVGVFWLSMVLYGHYRGLVRIAVTMSALILSLVVTRVAMPCVTAVLNDNTAIHQAIGQGLLHMAGVKEENEAADETEIQPAYQRNIIEGLKLPEPETPSRTTIGPLIALKPKYSIAISQPSYAFRSMTPS